MKFKALRIIMYYYYYYVMMFILNINSFPFLQNRKTLNCHVNMLCTTDI